MKRLFALLLVMVMLLFAACSHAQPIVDSELTTQPTVADPSSTQQPTDTSTELTTEPIEPPTEDSTEPSTGDPSDPPTEPTTEPTAPPTEPTTNPTQPSEPTTKPSEPGGNSSTDGTEKPSQPIEPSKPDQPSTDRDTDKTEKPSQPTGPNEDIEKPTEPSESVDVELTLSRTSVNLIAGQRTTLTATYNGTGTLTWSTSDASVATVSNGKVTAKSAGKATITVTDGSKKATCDVTVTAAVTLKINTQNNTTIFVADSLQIDYTYSGDKSELTWSSTDTSVATVNSNGVVTGKVAGATTIKLTNGSTTARVSITVSDAPKATLLNESSHNAPLYDGVVKYAGDYMSFQVSIKPDESNPNVIVTSSNTNVVSVSCELNSHSINVITLNFKSAGSATVTITSADGCVSKSYNITVKGDYDCNPGSGQLTPEQFAECYNGVLRANGINIDSVPPGYLVWNLKPQELTWETARSSAEALIHWRYVYGDENLALTYEGINENGKYVFYQHC